ncbi:hypothetical protein [Aquamicrobium terrae]|uniref:Uncharacterized protein n=1 Tax=Aquamicrobium terrae TaxID=1324945 RepID=A0ABV2MW06_9HYPH
MRAPLEVVCDENSPESGFGYGMATHRLKWLAPGQRQSGENHDGERIRIQWLDLQVTITWRLPGLCR